MLTPTVVVGPEELTSSRVRLVGDPYHHLFRVRRLSAGDDLRLVDGEGRARWARVVAVTRQDATLEIGKSAPANEREDPVELVVGALRRERASWLVEKATELGVTAVRFVASERSPRSFGDATFKRLRRVARSAVEQCGRSRLPELSGVHPWEEVAPLVDAVETAWVLDPSAPVTPLAGSGAALLLIGPEGGWSAEEREHLVSRGAQAAGLGPRILRVETAAVAALARLLSF